MLNKAHEKGVQGIVQLEYDEEITSTAELRAGLRHRPFRRLLDHEMAPQALEIANHSEETGSRFFNRIFACLVFSPLVQPLATFKDALDLLSILKDVVLAHRSLLQDANILHQDISFGTIVIAEENAQRRGVLID